MSRKMSYGSDLARAVADEINERRSRVGMSNRAFAEAIGVTHPYVGQRFDYLADFTLDDISRSAAVLGTSANAIINAAMRRMSTSEAEVVELRDFSRMAAKDPGYSPQDQLDGETSL